jgi:cold shock protein
MLQGTIKAWIADRGFGFIRRDDGQEDLFCHINEVFEDVERLSPGDRVTFSPGINRRTGKAEARDVRLLD